jgi:hypothetical protein
MHSRHDCNPSCPIISDLLLIDCRKQPKSRERSFPDCVAKMEGIAHHSSYRSGLPTEYMIDAATVSPINARWKSAVYCGLRKGLPVGRGVNAIKKCPASHDFLDASCGLKSDQRGRLLVEHAAATKSVL